MRRGCQANQKNVVPLMKVMSHVVKKNTYIITQKCAVVYMDDGTYSNAQLCKNMSIPN